ncbi:MAG TPA: hypothetical protein PLO37_06125 [Candidatus Hydrogenedentes bacterium]|nr:hypothetical protein [Candidatus Hydrogenedentota bacterium]HPG66407.1 hypothetical protein [Candidatus Hydrogenedentota bacterium]
MAAKNTIEGLLALAGKFVTDQNGAWEHEDWEHFLEEVAKLGFDLTDENKRNLGNILEACKFFYHCLPACGPTAKKAPAKRKAKA